ncbi:E3 ubiquitin-protein ligase TRIM56-like [Ptychodera flava]|uniref:E3 ubiquitin-protein ligase TRIM56-like n=1 Tax=Ptychodera flava TaxID=63121 RepID=UPI00396A1948
MAANSSVVENEEIAALKEDILTCQLCFESFVNPKILSCQHSFCERCLEQWVERNEGRLTCPCCRRVCRLTSQGVKGLPVNRIIANILEYVDCSKVRKTEFANRLQCETCPSRNANRRCVECAQYICARCSNVHAKVKTTRTHQIMTVDEFETERMINPAIDHPATYCKHHIDTVVNLYCKPCKQCICLNCALLEHPNPAHQYVSVDVAAREARENFKGTMQRIRYKRKLVSDNAALVRDEVRILQKQFEEGMAKIKEHAETIIGNVQLMRRRAEENCSQHFFQRRAALMRQLDTLELHGASLGDNYTLSELKLKHANSVEFLTFESAQTEQTQNLLSKRVNMEPSEKKNFYFKVTGRSSVEEFGEVQAVPPNTPFNRKVYDVNADLNVLRLDDTKISTHPSKHMLIHPSGDISAPRISKASTLKSPKSESSCTVTQQAQGSPMMQQSHVRRVSGFQQGTKRRRESSTLVQPQKLARLFSPADGLKTKEGFVFRN